MKISYLWSLATGLFYPVVQITIFVRRFNRFPETGYGNLIEFFVMGVLSGLFLIFLLRLTQDKTQRVAALVGYSTAIPLAIIGSLGGGLILPAFIGTILFGTTPLIIGTLVGWGVGILIKRFSK